ncbi:hypothetical protein TFLX_03990 [Thermoflexales bacterium]|nr:hypothetical protein TFLX_03990 [Thermoflexales bacterium]
MSRENTLLFLILIALIALPVSEAIADQGPLPAQHVSLVLVVDSSGSMANTDPNYLRRTSSKLLVSLLDIGDEVGFIEFGTDVIRSMDLIRIAGDSTKQAVLNELSKIATRSDWTDMKAAFKQACAIIGGANPENDRYIVFLTDGMPQPKESATWSAAQLAAYKQETKTVVHDCGVPVLSIGLSPQVDEGFLQELAGALPGGQVYLAKDASALPDAYLRIFGQLTDRNVAVARQESGDGNLLRLIDADPVTGEFVLKVNRAMLGVMFVLVQPGVDCSNVACLTITGPDDQIVRPGTPDVHYEVGVDYEVVSIPPIEGEWRIRLANLQQANLRAIIRSRLRMRLLAPSQFLQPLGQPLTLTVQVYREMDNSDLETVVGEPERKVIVSVHRPDSSVDALTLYDDGTHDDNTAGDGNFTNTYANTNAAGNYWLELQTTDGEIPVKSVSPQIKIDAFPVPILIAPQPAQLQPVGPGEAIELKARMELAGATPEVQLRSAWAEVRRSDDKPVSRIDMIVDGGQATGALKLDIPSTRAVVVIHARANYDGTEYETQSAPVELPIEIRPLLNYDLINAADFGTAFTIDKLKHVIFKAQALTGSNLRLRFEAIDVPDLQVNVQPITLIPAADTTVEISLEAGLNFKPTAGQIYSGTLLLNTDPQVEVRPAARIPFKFKLDKPSFTHTLDQADFGSINDLNTVSSISPLQFTVVSSLPSDLPLVARLVDDQGKDLDLVRPILRPPMLPASGISTVTLGLESRNEAGGPTLFAGRTITGKVLLNVRMPDGSEFPSDKPAPVFSLHERSQWDVFWQRVGSTVLAVLVLLLATALVSVILYLLAALAWGISRLKPKTLGEGWLVEGDAVAGGQEFHETGNRYPLSMWTHMRHRLFGVLISDQDRRTTTLPGSKLDYILSWPWRLVDDPLSPDLELFDNGNQGDRMLDAMNSATGTEQDGRDRLSKCARILRRKGMLQLMNMDSPDAIKVGRAVNDPSAGDRLDVIEVYGQPRTLKTGDLIFMHSKSYRYEESS